MGTFVNLRALNREIWHLESFHRKAAYFIERNETLLKTQIVFRRIALKVFSYSEMEFLD